ncbi:alkaline phosphatase D family protein [Spirillospora sp. NPDC047279]|uniref:alkaline phosphatase D family protein n=1 Tax=Spirillospora sp. NPDC047279 TaxID=3155478 RepID=UPI0033D4EDF5
MRLAQLGDGIANGAAVTSSNSGRRAGTPIELVTLGTGCAITADTSKAFLGGASVHVTTTAGQNAYLRWQRSFRTSAPSRAATMWLWFDSNPAASTSVLFLSNTSIQRCMEIRVVSTGHVRAYDSAGTTVASTTTPIALGQWVRVDVSFVLDATNGSVQLDLRNDPLSPTPTESVAPVTGRNFRTGVDNEVLIGTVNGSTAAQSYWIQAYLSDQGPAPFGTGFLLSGWVGNVSKTAATVTARVVGAGTVRVKASTASDLSESPVYSSSATPDADGVVRLNVSGLTEDSRYFYGFEVDGTVDSPMNGEFQTLPGAGPVSFSFAAASCARTWSNSAAFDAIRNYVSPAGKSPLFFAHLGDLHYEDLGINDQSRWHAAMDHVMTSPRQNEFYRKINVPYIWSDHDFSHPNADGSGAGGPAAQAVYRSRVPHYPLAVGDGKGIYHSFAVSDEVLFIVTDGRSYMDPIADPDDATKTKLGSVQKQWLMDQLANPDYLLKIWLHEDAWANGTTYVGDDTWSAYSTERAEIAAHITSSDANVAYIHGDLHVLAADDGSHVAGGFPVFVASPLDQTSYLGNGTYSAGTYPTYDSEAPEYFQQFGIFDVDWNGSSLSLTYKGMDAGGNIRITQTNTWAIPADSDWSIWDGTNEVPSVLEGLWDGEVVVPVEFEQIFPGV